MRCAVLDDLQGAASGLADWSAIPELDVAFFDHHVSDASALTDFDIIVTMRERVRFPAEVLASLPRLKLLVSTGMRNAAIDLEAASRLGITVCGTEATATPTVELTWALLLGIARGVVEENTALRGGGPWQSTLGADLHGRTLGVIGLGRIGGPVAGVGLAFGMRTLAWSRNLTAERAADRGATLAGSLDELLSTSDFVTIHLPLADGTRGLIGARELGLMQPDAYLINTSRAAIVDQDALLAALHEGRIAGAGVDVFDIEPLPDGHPMRTAPRLLATPHLGYVSRANYETYYRQSVEDIAAFIGGAPIRLLTRLP